MVRSTLIPLVVLGVVARPAFADIIVSQVYGGGGNAGAPYARDFVELFNPGLAAVVVDGWSVQYATARGSSWQVTPLAGTIDPGGYLLVAQARGSGGGDELPGFDVDADIALSAGSGKIAVSSSTDPLAGSCPVGPGVVAQVGYGTADCFRGSGPAPGLSNTTAAVRLEGGCRNEGDDALDFVADAPVPRDSSSPTLICFPFSPTVEPTEASTATPTATSLPSATPPSPSSPTAGTDPPSPTMTRTRTPTSTPSSQPSATASATASPSPSNSPSSHPPPTPTPEASCGNSVIDFGEHCDDGNRDDSDECPSGEGGCRYTESGWLVHGHPALRRVRQRGCWLGWFVVPGPQVETRRGRPLPHQRCRDQDARCDFDPLPGRCQMRVAACMNVARAEWPECSPRGVGAVTVVAPRGRERSPMRRGNRDAIEVALARLGDPTAPQAGFSISPPLAPEQRGLCSAPIPIVIELGALSRRSESIVLRSRTTDGQATRLDSRLRLTCMR